MRIIGNDPTKTRQTSAIASGTLPSGKPVVVNADGTVSVVTETSGTETLGSETQFPTTSNNSALGISATYDSANGKVVISYRDTGNSYYGTAVVGTVSGSSITWGTPVVYNSTSMSDYTAAAYDTVNEKVVIAYRDANTYGYAIVGTVSGNSISFGTATAFVSTDGANYIDMAYDASAGAMVINFNHQNGNGGKVIAGTVSGTSISFGTAVQFSSGTGIYGRSVYHPVENCTIIAWRDNTPSIGGAARALTVSGTTITLGTKVEYQSGGQANQNDIAYDSDSQKIVIICRDEVNVAYGSSYVGTVSGTSITFAARVTFQSGDVDWMTIQGWSTGGVVAVYDQNQTQLLKYGTISGTTITWSSALTVSSSGKMSATIGIAMDSANSRMALVYNPSGSASSAKYRVYNPDYTSTNLTAENYIGMSGGVLEDTNQSEAVGTPSVYATTEALQSDLAYDSTSGKMVLAWRDSNNTNGYGKAVVITVSGTTLSYGTPVTFNAASTRIPKVVFDSANNKIVIAYRNDGNNNYSTAIVGTVSGTSISFGTPVVWKSANNSGIGATYDPDNSKVIVGSAGTGAGAYEVFVGTVSGTSISFGSSSGSLGTAYSGELAYDEANNKVIAALHIYPSTGSTFVGTVSGTSISFGSANNITTSGFSDIWGLVYDSNSSNMVMCYQANGLYAIVGEVSGTSMTFGSSVVVQASSNEADIGYDSLINKPIVAFKDVGNSNNGTLKVGTVSGTSISFGSATVYETGDATQNAIGFDSGEGKSVISYSDGDNNSYGTAVAYQAAGSYQSRGEVADGGNAVVDVQGGISDIQENLTAGQSYYVQTDGTISTTAGSPSVFAGTAVSSTKLIVKG